MRKQDHWKIGPFITVMVCEDNQEEIRRAEEVIREKTKKRAVTNNDGDLEGGEIPADGVLVDMMFGNQPKGLGIALQCLAEGKPCIVVTHAYNNLGHLYGPWVGRSIANLEKLGVPVIYVTRPQDPKPWRTAIHKLFELISQKFLDEDSEPGEAWRRYCRKFLLEDLERVS